MEHAFERLGIDEHATRAEIRRAWRRLAKAIHPDVNDSPDAAREFHRLRAAYREALRQADLRAGRPVRRSRAPRPAAPPPRARFRYACGSCDDSYAFAGECPRCGVALQDERQGPVCRQAEDPAIAAFVAELESPTTSRIARLGSAIEQRPSLLALGLAFLGAYQASLGLVGLAILSLGFAMVWVAAEAHGRLQHQNMTAWRRSAD